jgi:hypothetical protein
MRFIKKIDEYKLQLINEAYAISKKSIDLLIESYYDKYDSFSEEIKTIVNKYIFKNILESSLIKKYTINGVLDKEGFSQELKKIVDSTSSENIAENKKNASKEIVNKSISEFIYNNILKILTIRKRKDEVLSDINSTTAITLAPFFIKFYLTDNISKDELQSFFESLKTLDYKSDYFRFLDFNKFKNVSYKLFKELYDFLISRVKIDGVRNDNYDFKTKSGSILSYSLIDYIGKETKENCPSWWPFESSAPFKPASKEYNLSDFVINILNKSNLFKDSNNLTDDDMHHLTEIIGDKLTELSTLFKIARFVRLMPVFINKNKANGEVGEEVNLKSLFYNLKSKDLQNETSQVAETNYRKGNSEKSKDITRKALRNRNIEKILEDSEDVLGSIVPTTPDTTLEEIDDINRKFGKKQGVEILWQDEDKLITQVNSYEANYILNGEGTKYSDQKRSDHCIAWASGRNHWNNYVGTEGPVNESEYRLQFYIYDFTREARKSNKWTIGISLGLSKRIINGACQDSKNVFINENELKDFFRQEEIPFFEVLDKVDPNDEGTKYEGMTLFEKHVSIKQKQIETNLKIKSGNLTIEEIEEALEEGADINAYGGVLIKKSINDLERIKYLISKGASVQYLFDEVDNIIKVKNFELLKFLINNGLDVSNYKITNDVVENYDIFKLLTDSWKKFTSENITEEVFDNITDVRILFLLYNKEYDFKKAIQADIDPKSRKANFFNKTKNQDNYPIIKFLFDNNILPKYTDDNYYNVFPININVYHLFILNNYPINYQDSTCLYNFAKDYIKNKTNPNDLENILNSFITEKIIYKKSCPTCKGYGVVEEKKCHTCKSTGLSNQLDTYNSKLNKESNLLETDPYESLLKNPHFSELFFNVLVKLKTIGVNVDLELFESYLNKLDNNYILKKKDILRKVFNLYSDVLQDKYWTDLLSKLKNLGLV